MALKIRQRIRNPFKDTRDYGVVEIDDAPISDANGVPVKVVAGGPLSVAGPLTDGQLRATDVAVTLDGEQVTVVPPAAAAVVTPVDAATVAASAWSALDGQATGGHGWAAVLVVCDQNHTVRGVAGLEDFSDYTKGGSIPSDYTGKTDNTAKGGEWYVFDVSGRTHFCPTVQNNGATDATVTCKVVFFD